MTDKDWAELFRTTDQSELLVATDALKQAGIPHRSTGSQLTAATIGMGSQGFLNLLYVPQERAEEAKTLLASTLSEATSFGEEELEELAMSSPHPASRGDKEQARTSAQEIRPLLLGILLSLLTFLWLVSAGVVGLLPIRADKIGSMTFASFVLGILLGAGYNLTLPITGGLFCESSEDK